MFQHRTLTLSNPLTIQTYCLGDIEQPAYHLFVYARQTSLVDHNFLARKACLRLLIVHQLEC